MDPAGIRRLRCPDCMTGFVFTAVRQENIRHSDAYGLLRCQCFLYPVVDGVPIIMKGHVGTLAFAGVKAGTFESMGPDVSEVARAVSEGRGLDALIQCLAYTPHVEFLDQLPGWRFWHMSGVRAIGRRWVERRVRRMLGGDAHELAAEDWFEHFFGDVAATDRSLLPYYRNRFVLPRTLAAWSLLRLLPASSQPVLDLGCGLGPFGHYLTHRHNPMPVIGLDFNFYLVWGQKHLIAPRGTFICADVRSRLPFDDDTFSAVFCSDAFAYFPDKAHVATEVSRCAYRRPLILTRVSNRTAFPRDGDALDAEAYMDLLDPGEVRAFSEYALVRDYLAQRNPLTAKPTDPKDLHWDKWLTFVVNGDSLRDVRIDAGEGWPHETGELTFNPIFERTPLTTGRVRCHLEFPTVWFAYQNGDMYAYHADRVECSPDIEVRARSNRADPEVRQLVKQFILIGLPQRYLRSQLQRAPLAGSTAAVASPVAPPRPSPRST